MTRARKTKIVATLGPMSDTVERVRALHEAGADVFRLNASHGTHATLRRSYDVVRRVEAECGRPLGIVFDLQGPKIRIGAFATDSVELAAGSKFRLDLSDAPGDVHRVQLPHAKVMAALAPDQEVLLDDGRLRLRIDRRGPDFVETTVVTGGRLSNRKGVNLPGITLPLSPLTAKDHVDLQFGLDLGVDWIALSFVQRPDDIAEARRLIAGRAAVLAKIEKPSAIDRLDELIELADACMVARGDLGVELPPEDVPGLQKRIIAASRRAGKPVIVATQMLESMVHAPAPTRAEASDVATAVYDGADALMLSAESATGAYPVEAVAMMDRIIARTEKDPIHRQIMDAQRPELEATAADAISAAAAQAALTLSAAAIVTYTMSGSTALRAARERPHVPVLCLTARLETARRMALAWGTHCVYTDDVHTFSEMVDKACRIALEQGMAKRGDRIIVTAGVPFGTPGSTNILRIAWIGG